MTSSHTPPSPIENSSADDEIDLRQVGGALLRHKRLIGAVTGSALVLSTFYAFTRKPVWEGHFQIVLQSNQQSAGSGLGSAAAILQSNAGLASLIGLGGGKSELETEVKILESPSVLKPVFDFLKASKAKRGEDTSGWRYSSWASNLRIQLAPGTSVLEIAYRDIDKDFILPVLDRISNAYQTYSDRDRTRGLNNAVLYLEAQIKKLDNEANASMRAAQNFGLDNDLGITDGLGVFALAQSSSGGSSGGGSVESSRNAAQNKVNALEQTLNEAQASGGTRVFVAPQIEANSELYGQLQNIESRLQEKSSLLLPNDPSIRALERERQSLTAVINNQIIGLLKGEIQTAQAELDSLSRPNEVIFKHRELVSNALRDERILSELELQLRTIQLEQARQSEPWELSSNPTLLDSPVAPRKKRIMAMGLLAGLLLGSGAALVVDRRTGLVFSSDELKRFIPCPLLKHLSALSPDSWHDAADLLANGPLSVSAPGPIALVSVGNVPNNQLKRFSSELQRALGSRELLVSNDLRETSRCATQLLVAAPGVATRTQLSQLKQKLALQATPLAGWVLLDPDLELG